MQEIERFQLSFLATLKYKGLHISLERKGVTELIRGCRGS